MKLSVTSRNGANFGLLPYLTHTTPQTTPIPTVPVPRTGEREGWGWGSRSPMRLTSCVRQGLERIHMLA